VFTSREEGELGAVPSELRSSFPGAVDAGSYRRCREDQWMAVIFQVLPSLASTTSSAL